MLKETSIGLLFPHVINHGGLFAEIPDQSSECALSEDTELGSLIKEKLECCKYKSNFDYSKHTKKDWPAYVLSGLKTMKAFEKQFICYSIRGINESNHFYRIESPELGNNIRLSILSSASEIDSQIGTEALKLHKFYLKSEEIT